MRISNLPFSIFLGSTSFLTASTLLATATDLPGGIPGISQINNNVRGGTGNGFGGGNGLDGVSPPSNGNGGAGLPGAQGSRLTIGGAVGATTIDPTVMVIQGNAGGNDNGGSDFIPGGPTARGSGGGGGGAGVYLDGVTATTHSGLVIIGGIGGRGGAARTNSGIVTDALSGGGGAGVVVNGGYFSNVAGALIVGGAGGSGGNIQVAGVEGGGGGGDGVVVQNGATFLNEGRIEGGTGGLPDRLAAPSNLFGAGGAGIRGGNNAYIINAGTAKAGDSRRTTQPASDAIMLVGSNGTLELRAASNIDGRATAISNSNNRLALGGAVDDRFDANETGSKYVGFDSIRKIGTSRWDVSGDTNTSPFSVEEGTMAVNDTLGGPLTASGGRLIGSGSVESIVDQAGGTVAPGDNSFGTMTVRKNFTAQGGTVEIATVLGGDQSATSRLLVEGSTIGSGFVRVINKGGSGALTEKGITVIAIQGQSGASFALVGDAVANDGRSAVVAGAHAYKILNDGAASNDRWFLSSRDKDGSPILNPGAPLHEGAVQTMRLLNRLPTLQQRVGNRYWSGRANSIVEQGDGPGVNDGAPSPEAGSAIDGNGMWASIGGDHTHLKPEWSPTGLKQETNIFTLRAGFDALLYENGTGKLIGGLLGQYDNARSKIRATQWNGQVDTQGGGVGATLT
ncbi:autotransporter outer membrane beta-barrel domain-containing protein [Ochrobactrum teleogrylli]|uniref:Autotransporter outer membrane beta-barrel domain-containing protein n=1 Tax=Ochrobactrum teleogrylli TaxID=2479765 RepID=A0ABY2Y6C3_9HYPH|nr:autotransporter outer membrane beta-barrel domain-containing protein [[Ochrobactrum] teleogrylli]